MTSPHRNHEDRVNKEDLNIPAQTQKLQAVTPIMVDTRQHITDQASFSRDHNHNNSDNHQIPTSLPPFDKDKLLAMQAKIMQGKMQPNTVTSHSTKLTKGPMKRQVTEAWNHQKNKRSHGTPELEIERQNKDIKRPGVCRCCKHYGNLCLQGDSLLTEEARERYYSDINRKLSMQDPNIEGDAQAKDSKQVVNLEDWTTTFKEFQPKRSKPLKKQNRKASQERIKLPQPLEDGSTLPCSNPSQAKIAQLPNNNFIKRNSGAQVIPSRAMVKHKGSQDGYNKIVCFRCSGEGHYAYRCPTKRKKTRFCDLGLYCLKCGGNGHLASWCEKEDDDRPQFAYQSPMN